MAEIVDGEGPLEKISSRESKGKKRGRDSNNWNGGQQEDAPEKKTLEVKT